MPVEVRTRAAPRRRRNNKNGGRGRGQGQGGAPRDFSNQPMPADAPRPNLPVVNRMLSHYIPEVLDSDGVRKPFPVSRSTGKRIETGRDGRAPRPAPRARALAQQIHG